MDWAVRQASEIMFANAMHVLYLIKLHFGLFDKQSSKTIRMHVHFEWHSVSRSKEYIFRILNPFWQYKQNSQKDIDRN